MPDQGFPDKVWLARNPDGSFAPGWLMASESHRYLSRAPYVPESRAIDAETELSLEKERVEKLESVLREIVEWTETGTTIASWTIDAACSLLESNRTVPSSDTAPHEKPSRNSNDLDRSTQGVDH